MSDTSKAGITTNADGTRSIASSVRADGTVRKEIKIRPGYRPPEDVEKYKNRTAEAFRNRGKGGVLGAELANGDVKAKENQSAAASKNAKRKEARKKAAAEKGEEEGDQAIGNGSVKKDESPKKTEAEEDPEAAQAKQARNLAKKLKQAKALKESKEKGETLLPEQLQKVIRINELVRQLDAMGFDNEGKKKGEEGGSGP